MNSVPITGIATQYRERQAPPSRSSGFEFYFLIILLFVLYSRAFDFFPVPYVPMFTFIAALVATVLSGRFAQLFHPRISKLWLMLTAWYALSAALSIWRAGSIGVLEAWLKALSVYLVIVGLVTTFDQCYRAVRTVAWAIGTLSVLSLVYGGTTSGRFFLEGGKFQGPNELAQVLLFGVPLLALIFSRSPIISVKRVITLGLLLILANILLHTGSRGAMITAVVMSLVAIANARSKGTAIALVAGGFVMVLGTLAFSESIRTRYLTFFNSAVEEGSSRQAADMAAVASDSAGEHWRLLLDSLVLTAENPLLGAGPGMFAEARERRAGTQQKHVGFLLTHNTYTEVSSEAGIPAAILFIAIVVGCFRTANRIRRLAKSQPSPRMREVAAVAAALKFGVLAYGITSLFISVAYQSLLPTLAGLIVALEFTVLPELSAKALSTPAPTPAVAAFPRQPAPPKQFVPALGSKRRA